MPTTSMWLTTYRPHANHTATTWATTPNHIRTVTPTRTMKTPVNFATYPLMAVASFSLTTLPQDAIALLFWAAVIASILALIVAFLMFAAEYLK